MKLIKNLNSKQTINQTFGQIKAYKLQFIQTKQQNHANTTSFLSA